LVTTRISKIYLVDDSDDEIFMAKIFFKKQNIGAELTAFSRLELLYEAIFEDPAFNLRQTMLIIDLNLTVCKGTEGIIHIRNLEKDQRFLMGISTGSEDPADRHHALSVGADFFVGKPVDRATILAIADSVPNLTPQEDEGRVLNLYLD